MKPFDFVSASSVPEAIDLLAEHGADAHLLAGGTALMLMMKQDLVQPKVLVGLNRIEGLRGIRSLPGGGLEIGALTTHRQAERSELVRAHASSLADAFGHVATVRIRNQATLGGNLVHADPAQDPPPMLMALGASVEVSGLDGDRTIPLDELFVDYYETSLADEEVVRAVRLPALPVSSRSRYLKFLPRTQDDYATVSVAAWLDLASDGRCSDVRLALGAAGPTPLRLTATENALRGQRLSGGIVEEAADLVRDEVDPIDDIRGSADYKREMARIWVGRVLHDLLKPEG
jgi:aerobic carbon-monoxide dehydrogenase medium subunit